jgi:mannosyltransferase
MTGVHPGRYRRAHARTAGRTGDRADAVPGVDLAPGTHGTGGTSAKLRPPAASGASIASGPPGAAAGRSLAERLLVPAIPGILGLVTGVYHLGAPPLWRDEAATKAIASRSVGQILATMPHDDVVHGAYYLVAHVFLRLLGSSNHALRLPSAIAAAVACAVTALVAQRLAAGGGRWYPALTGVTAGAVLALLPAMIRYAQEARSYAIVTMLAAIAGYLLLRAVDGGGRPWWAAYGAAVFLTGLFNVFGLLVVAAHGLTLLATGWAAPGTGGGPNERRGRAHAAGLTRAPVDAGTAATGAAGTATTAAEYYGDLASPAVPKPGRRQLVRAPLGWLTAGVVAVLLLVPLLAMAYVQRDALSWATEGASVGRETAALAHFWAGSRGLVWPVFGLAAVGVAASLIAGPRSLSPATVALPWLVAPPAILLAVSAAYPVYDERYVEFCLPALAICVASGITWLWRLAAIALGRLTRGGTASGRGAVAWLACLPAIAVAAALAVALQPADAVVRQPGYRPDDLEYEAQIIAANYKPGDIVLFIPINDRIVSMPFPGPWQKLRDIALAVSPVSSDTLYGTDVSPAELLKRFTHVTRVWVVFSSEVPTAAYLDSGQATPLDKEEFALVEAMRRLHRWRDGDTELTLYATRPALPRSARAAGRAGPLAG